MLHVLHDGCLEPRPTQDARLDVDALHGMQQEVGLHEWHVPRLQLEGRAGHEACIACVGTAQTCMQ